MTPEWQEEFARVEIRLKEATAEQKEAELRLDNALRHLAEVHADQIERDRKLRESLLRAIAAMLEGLRRYPKMENRNYDS